MSERRRVSTVEEALYALAQGEQVQFVPERPDYVPGAGLDPLPEDKETLWLLQQHHVLDLVEQALKPGVGRPKLGARLSVHAHRALLAWYVFHRVMEASQSRRVTDSQIIHAARALEQKSGVLERKRLFGSGRVDNDKTLGESLSRGRTELGIGPDWESDFCKEYWG